MKIISTKVHGILDYIMGAIFIAMPWIAGMNKYMPESFVFIGAGIFTLTISVLTRYEYGILKRIPVKTHLLLDALVAIFLIASPWIFGYSSTSYLPYVIFGILELVVVAISDRTSLKDDKFLDGGEIYHVAHQTVEEGIRTKG